MINRMILTAMLVMLTGCTGLVDKVKNTTLKEEYFSGSVERTRECLNYQAIQHHFYFEEDDPLPNGSRRFNLLKNNNEVVNLDINKSGRHTLVNFFYDKRDKNLENTLTEMIHNCHRALD